MNFYSPENIANILNSKAFFNFENGKRPIFSYYFDTRLIVSKENSMFLALKSSRRDGHKFLEEAYSKGIKNFLISDEKFINSDWNANFIVCEYVLDGIQNIAKFHLNDKKAVRIGITGSNGKTIVKEWLASLLEEKYEIAKSPQSFNSQLGVALSLLGIRSKDDFALIEAGISQKGEMQVLQNLIQPEIGIFTHFGLAHQDGFASQNEKLFAKISLFKNSKIVLCNGDNEEVISALKKENLAFQSIGFQEYNDFIVRGNYLNFTIKNGSETSPNFHFHLSDNASFENLLLVVLVAKYLGFTWEEIQNKIPDLVPVSMRTEIITDNPEITIINDTYNSDLDSLKNSMHVLKDYSGTKKQKIIISDIGHQGRNKEKIHVRILKELIENFTSKNIITIGPIFKKIQSQFETEAYLSTEEFIQQFDYDSFKNCSVLLKGARTFKMEKIIPFLTLKPNATFLKINLTKLSENFKEFRKIIPNQTKVMLMLKAAGYGNGTWEIAQILERENVDYLAVAYTSEGIDLRQKNVKLPILVLNPDSTSLEQLINFDLEPSIGSLEFLKLLQRTANYTNKKMKIHLEFDTGMGRLGFFKHEINEILEHLAESLLIPVSIFSHLAASDEPEHDDFTRKQIADFQEFTLPFKQKYPELIRHILNTAGIFRFPEAYFEMVRIGIGLYGIPPIEKSPIFLQEIGTLQTVISQIHTYTEKTSISYSRSQFVEKDSVIATIPIGYADGIPRRLSGGKMNCLVHGQKVPVVGKICMDMLMLDITKVENVKEGDEVVIFGEQENENISIQEFARQADTISYEILTGISSRVRRIYFKE